MKNKRSATEMDEYIGSRLKQFRTMKGLSQSDLGEKLDLTFQQIQKYENGTNKIAASRLYSIAYLLDVSVIDFFPKSENSSLLDDMQDCLKHMKNGIADEKMMLIGTHDQINFWKKIYGNRVNYALSTKL